MGRPKKGTTTQAVQATFPVTLPDTYRDSSEKCRFGVYSDHQKQAILTRHRNAKLKETSDAQERRFLLDGEPSDRWAVMSHIVGLVAGGMSLVDLCDEPGMPTLLEVRHWRKWHESFDKELKEADACRGERLGEEATRVAMDAAPDANAAVLKLQHEALSKAAARLNSDFQDKKLVQTEDITERQTYEQLAQRWKFLVKQYPALKELSDSVGVTEAEVVEEDSLHEDPERLSEDE